MKRPQPSRHVRFSIEADLTEIPMKLAVLTAIVGCMTLPWAAYGQEPGGALGYEPQVCQATVEAVQGGDEIQDRMQALWYLRFCGSDGASALASELARLRTVSDLSRLHLTYHPIAAVTDAEILDAALQLAGDQGATAESRIMAMRLLMSYEGNSEVMPPLASFLAGGTVQLVGERRAAPIEVTALASDWELVARTLLTRMANDAGERDPVRNAARWALSSF
jgi:hypothetical protein